MTRDEKRQALEVWVNFTGGTRAVEPEGINEALYSMSELGLWPDNVDSVSVEQVMTCWRLVERLRTHRLPEDLKM